MTTRKEFFASADEQLQRLKEATRAAALATACNETFCEELQRLADSDYITTLRSPEVPPKDNEQRTQELPPLKAPAVDYVPG